MSEGRGQQLRTIVAVNVRRFRRQRKMSQEALAAAANLHRTYVGSVERSERNLSIDSIGALADGLGVEAWCLLVSSPSKGDPDS
ncbi:helix-turn-helix domain-containing protein [Brevundimonas diminuta]|uniref:Transcriptional regulator n=2 Tax=Brevundimonas TaxID=41275 RepID=A0A1Z3M1Q2_BREDI|nr:transcriptional regulator [Brevundimonas diminuta]